MVRLATLMLGITLIFGAAGCSNSTAAPVKVSQVGPSASDDESGLAPSTSPVSAAPIRIPDARKSLAPSSSTIPSTSSQPEKKITQPILTQQDPPKKEDRFRRDTNRQNREGSRGERMEFKIEGNGGDNQRRRFNRDESKQNSLPGGTSAASPSPAPVAQPPTASPSNNSPSTSPVGGAFPLFGSSSGMTARNITPAFTVTYGTGSEARGYKKPTVPANTPSWFTDNEKDGDGQIAMHEWPGDRLDEFKKYDRNLDGFITLEEALRTVPKAAVASTAVPAVSTTTTAPPATVAATPSSPAPVGSTTVAPVAAPGATFSVSTSGPGAPGAPLSEEDARRRVDMSLQFTDRNRDGVLDAQEIDNSRQIKAVDWKKYDANHDSKLDKNELTALYKAEGNNMARGGMGGGGGMGGAGPWGGNNDERMKTMFNSMDKKKTGKIAKEDFPGFWQSRFEEFDVNKDGFVDFEEYKTNFDKVMRNMREGGGRGRGGEGGGRGEGGGPGRGGFGGPGGGNGGQGRRSFGGPGG